MKKTILIPALIAAIIMCGGNAFGGVINESGPNDTLENPMDLGPKDFNIMVNDDIIASQSVPWVSILATGNDTFDFYSFVIPEGEEVDGYFDIDHAFMPTFDLQQMQVVNEPIDLMLHLFNSEGAHLQTGDDSPVSDGAGGSLSDKDPYMEYTFTAPGEYLLAVGRYLSEPSPDAPFLVGDMPEYNDFYTLQISLEAVDDHCKPIPLPASIWLLGSAAVSLLGFGRKKKML